jgi:hypothetical protein
VVTPASRDTIPPSWSVPISSGRCGGWRRAASWSPADSAATWAASRTFWPK